MKLATFLPPGAVDPLAGVVAGDRVSAFGDHGGVKRVLAGGAVPDERLGEWALSEVTLCAPVPDPRTMFGIGLNYAEHVAETGSQRPEQPLVFAKLVSSLSPPAGPVRCPQAVHRLDYEGELAIVIGAEEKIGGYCVADDVTGRDLQRREPQWVRGKGSDTFCPLGPWITTVDEVGDPENLWIKTWVNGELRQDSSTSELIFGPEELIAFITQTCTLAPGDVILTGTPSGVAAGMDPSPWLQSGDVIRIEIERLGSIEHAVA